MQFLEPIEFTLKLHIKMEFRIYEARQDNIIFRIEEDYPEVGAYLYIIENGKCIKDFLQNSIESCQSIAFEEYNIPKTRWKLIHEK